MYPESLIPPPSVNYPQPLLEGRAMVPRKTRAILKLVRTLDIFESKVARAAIRSGLLPTEHNHSGSLPLLGGEWPFQTTWVLSEIRDR